MSHLPVWGTKLSYIYFIQIKFFWGSFPSHQNPLIIDCLEIPRDNFLIQRAILVTTTSGIESRKASPVRGRALFLPAVLWLLTLTADVTWAVSLSKCSPGRQGVSWGLRTVACAHTEPNVWWTSMQVQFLPYWIKCFLPPCLVLDEGINKGVSCFSFLAPCPLLHGLLVWKLFNNTNISIYTHIPYKLFSSPNKPRSRGVSYFMCYYAIP